ncbi:MAG: hypothetical protein ACFB8W_08770 [Elainellaceae cyanobacterium]
MNDVSSTPILLRALAGNLVVEDPHPSMMLPILIDESLIRRFKYWHGGIRDAMIFRSRIYVYYGTYLAAERANAFQVATRLSTASQPACITASNEQYIVWQDVRSLR